MGRVWQACKERVAEIATQVPNTVVADFMLPSPITRTDDNYWDALHYRVAIADRLARDLAVAGRGEEFGFGPLQVAVSFGAQRGPVSGKTLHKRPR